MTTPCFMDNRFIGTTEEMTEAAKDCAKCPVWEACRELGLGEKDGVYGGLTPTHPLRKAARAARRNKKSLTCPQGHPRELYGTVTEGPGAQPIQTCARCAALQLYITAYVPGRSGPMPETAPVGKADTILRHGTEGGYKAHKRRQEEPCPSCLEGNRAAQERRAGDAA